MIPVLARAALACVAVCFNVHANGRCVKHTITISMCCVVPPWYFRVCVVVGVILIIFRSGVDEDGNFKKTETFLHKGGVQEFVELMCKEKQHLHPDMKVGFLIFGRGVRRGRRLAMRVGRGPVLWLKTVLGGASGGRPIVRKNGQGPK